MVKFNLLAKYPKTVRKIEKRIVNKAINRTIALKFGKEYFDGTRNQGYGGYKYDGRWIPIAEDIVNRYNLKEGSKVLDIGCAKGFLVKDLMIVCPGIQVFGIDISEYAIKHCEREVIGRLHVGNAKSLPFPDNSFDFALSINTIHNLNRGKCLEAIKEIKRVSPKASYIQVDAYNNEKDKQKFVDWVLTAKTHGTPDFWKKLFLEAGYDGDYFWTFL
jgi:SAM-dependent methyltransferase